MQKHDNWFVLGTFCFIQLLLFVNGELVSNEIIEKLAMQNHANNSMSTSKLIFHENNDDEDIFQSSPDLAFFKICLSVTRKAFNIPY